MDTLEPSLLVRMHRVDDVEVAEQAYRAWLTHYETANRSLASHLEGRARGWTNEYSEQKARMDLNLFGALMSMCVATYTSLKNVMGDLKVFINGKRRARDPTMRPRARDTLERIESVIRRNSVLFVRIAKEMDDLEVFLASLSPDETTSSLSLVSD